MKFFVLSLLPALLLVGCETAITPAPDASYDIPALKARAATGDAEAQYELGLAYSQIWKNEEADGWFRKAAEQNVADAQYHLGDSYANGLGVSRDDVEAYAWFSVATLQGHVAAINARQSLASRLHRSEVEEAEGRASVYISEILSRHPLPQPAPNYRPVSRSQGSSYAAPKRSTQDYHRGAATTAEPPTTSSNARTTPAIKPASQVPAAKAAVPQPKPATAAPQPVFQQLN
jgi:hypothetical protein